MTLHAVIQYLKYICRAKGRHGMHSPFVYDLIVDVLLDKGPIPRESIVEVPEIGLSYENLISRICAYYRYNTILFLPSDNVDNARADFC